MELIREFIGQISPSRTSNDRATKTVTAFQGINAVVLTESGVLNARHINLDSLTAELIEKSLREMIG